MPLPDANPALVEEWKRYLTALATHEAGHREVVQAGAIRIQRALLELQPQECGFMQSAAQQVAQPLLAQITLDDRRYDETTRHGATAGLRYGRRTDSQRGCSIEEIVEDTPDGKAIDQLARSGSDLNQLHQVDFTLRFPTQQSAQRAELELIGFAFLTKIERGKGEGEWIIHATKVMYPVETDLAGLREKLDAIAAKGRGSYDGWKAKVFVRKSAG